MEALQQQVAALMQAQEHANTEVLRLRTENQEIAARLRQAEAVMIQYLKDCSHGICHRPRKMEGCVFQEVPEALQVFLKN